MAEIPKSHGSIHKESAQRVGKAGITPTGLPPKAEIAVEIPSENPAIKKRQLAATFSGEDWSGQQKST
jgi:hypothetical protein